jgi:hypothetical protein
MCTLWTTTTPTKNQNSRGSRIRPGRDALRAGVDRRAATCDSASGPTPTLSAPSSGHILAYRGSHMADPSAKLSGSPNELI